MTKKGKRPEMKPIEDNGSGFFSFISHFFLSSRLVDAQAVKVPKLLEPNAQDVQRLITK